MNASLRHAAGEGVTTRHFAYVACYSPSATRRLQRRLIARFNQVARYPESGRIVPEFQERRVRELIDGDYRIWYRVQMITSRLSR
ncbi:MAG: type II toxin-antitoxin system RelE/ParE family toxin [Dehalococcoidia bacterium]